MSSYELGEMNEVSLAFPVFGGEADKNSLNRKESQAFLPVNISTKYSHNSSLAVCVTPFFRVLLVK